MSADMRQVQTGSGRRHPAPVPVIPVRGGGSDRLHHLESLLPYRVRGMPRRKTS